MFLPSKVATSETENDEYCQFGNGVVLVLVDRTTMYDDMDREELREGMAEIFRSMGIGDRLAIATIVEDYRNSQIVFNDCKPGCPEVGLREWLFSTCRPIVAKSHGLQFQARFVATVRPLVEGDVSFPRSAIIETIETVTEKLHAHRLERILVFSDLLENSNFLPWPRILKVEPGTAAWAKIMGELTPRLEGTRVTVLGFGRLHSPGRPPLSPDQRRQLLNFWDEYFRSSGAVAVDISEGR